MWMTVYEEFEWRGVLYDATEGTAELLAREKVTAYIGFDPTASSLHVGSLLPIMCLARLQRMGHSPVALVGGGTGLIGDPSGKSQERTLLSAEEVEANGRGLRAQLERFLDFDAPNAARMVNNLEWLSPISFLDFLRDVGKHFTVNAMLARESVKRRIGSDEGLSFTEFSYQLLQAYDYLVLHERMGCTLQMGGSDQWGNIVSGVDLGRRLEQPQLYGLTTPLITLADGGKMGKTASGAIWLNEDRLPVYDYWQFWRNTLDADVGRFLKLFTEMPLAEIAKLEALEGAELNEAKKILATEATALLHGRAKAEQAAETARKAFEEGAQAEGLPTVELPAGELQAGVAAFELFRRAGLAGSNGEARRLVRGGGARLNDEALQDENRTIGAGDLTDAGTLKLSAGRKRHVLVRPV